MKTTLTKTAAGYLTVLSLITSPFVSLQTDAMPSQNAFTSSSVRTAGPVIDTQARPVKPEKDAVLVRNTTSKTDPVTPATTAKKTEDKKTISRCWKRLMNMAREVRHAHSSAKK